MKTELAHIKLARFITFHPRAYKLLEKNKPFLVVAEDEPYYLDVYNMIRSSELENGTWTNGDEIKYKETKKKLEENN